MFSLPQRKTSSTLYSHTVRLNIVNVRDENLYTAIRKLLESSIEFTKWHKTRATTFFLQILFFTIFNISHANCGSRFSRLKTANKWNATRRRVGNVVSLKMSGATVFLIRDSRLPIKIRFIWRHTRHCHLSLNVTRFQTRPSVAGCTVSAEFTTGRRRQPAATAVVFESFAPARTISL